MDSRRLVNLGGALAAMTVFGFTIGLMFPLLSLVMERQGAPPEIIGYNAAMQPLGILTAALFVHRLVARFGSKRAVIGAALLTAAVVLAYPVTPIYWGWFGLRFLHGLFVSVLFAVSEAWIVRYAEGPYRSRILAIYSSLLAASFGSGPALISWTGTETALPFIIGCAVLVVAVAPVFLMREEGSRPHDAEPAASALAFAPRAPVLLAAIGVFGIVDAANLGFLPVYGVMKGLAEETAALALSVFVYGNIFLQFPIGWIADHVNKRLVMLVCAIVTAIACVLTPISFGTPVFWALLVITGSASAGIYTVALSELGDRFSGSDLMAGTAAFSIMWGLGAQIGALSAGWSIAGLGPDGLPYTMSAVFAAFALAVALRGFRRMN